MEKNDREGTETTGAASTGQPVVEPKEQKSQASFFRCTFTWMGEDGETVRCSTRAVEDRMWVPGVQALTELNGGTPITSGQLRRFVLCGGCVRKIREHDAKLRFFHYAEGLQWLLREEGRQQSAASAFAQRLTGSSQQRRGSAPWGEATPADVAAYRAREREREESRPRRMDGKLDEIIAAAMKTASSSGDVASVAAQADEPALPSEAPVTEDMKSIENPCSRRPNGKRARRARQEAAVVIPPNGQSNGAAAMPAPTMACTE